MCIAQIAELIPIAVQAGMQIRIDPDGTVSLVPVQKSALSDAERARLYRQRKAAAVTNVTRNVTHENSPTVTPAVTPTQLTVTNVTENVTKRDASPSPSPPFPSTPPLPPAPTPAGEEARVREERPAAKETSLEQAKRLAVEANAEPFPLSMPPMPGFAAFQAAWAEWCDYRTERATAVLKSDRVPWTRRAARNGLLEIERVAAGVGMELITQRIRQAIGGSWQGLNLERMSTTNGNGSRPNTAPSAAPPAKLAPWQMQPARGTPEWEAYRDKRLAEIEARKQQSAQIS